MDCVRYVLAKGHDVLIIDRPRNAITKQIITATRTAGATCIETLLSLMLQIVWLIHLSVDMCRDTIHIVVEGHDHWGDKTKEMCMPTCNSAAARLKGEHARKWIYLFHLGFSGQTILQGCVQLQELHHDQRDR